MIRVPRNRPPWSITRRLTVLYAASALGILSIAASVLYLGLARSLRAEDDRFVLAKARELRTIATRFPGRLDMLRDEIGFESAMPTLQGYLARVVAGDGVVEVESHGMDRRLPATSFPSPGANPIERHASNGQVYLLYSARLTLEGSRIVQVALEVSRDARVLDAQLALLATVVLLGALASAAAGYAIARRGLRPIDRISATATNVSAERLQERLGVTSWPAELSELARVFDRMLDRLQESFRRLSRFSADIAHELRTPLTNLRGAAEVALRRPRAADEYRAVLESALEEYARLADMIDRLLFIGRADAGAAALARENIDLRAEIDAICDYFTPVAEETGVVIERDGEASVDADPLLMRRALGNLLDNALAHTPAGGRIRVSAAAENGSAVLCVADTGTGIDSAHLPFVFDRFYRADESKQPGRSGVGLGLPLVRSIAELHGGSATIESTPGEGTTVRIVFPTARQSDMTPP